MHSNVCLGLALLNDALNYCASTSESSEEYESCDALIDGCKALLGPTELHLALTETSSNHADRMRREKDVQRSLMEVHEVRRMM